MNVPLASVRCDCSQKHRFSPKNIVGTTVCTQTVRSSLSAPKCFRCAEVLFLPKAYELPDGRELPDSNIFTVGVKRFRYAEVLCQPAFSQRIPRHFVPEQPGMRRVHPHVCVRQCRLISGTNVVLEVYERTTKERTASAPSAMKFKAVAPPDDIIPTAGATAYGARKCCSAKRFRAKAGWWQARENHCEEQPRAGHCRRNQSGFGESLSSPSTLTIKSTES